MKKLFSYFVIGILTIPILGNKSKADYNKWAIKFGTETVGEGASAQASGTIEIYNYNSLSGTESLINKFVQADESLLGVGDDGRSVHWRFLSLNKDNQYDSQALEQILLVI